MPPQREAWTTWLGDNDRMEVWLWRDRREVTRFSVQYLAEIGADWHAIVRFDTAHGRPHMDSLWPDGTRQVESLASLDKNRAFTYAIDDIKARRMLYRARYEERMQRR